MPRRVHEPLDHCGQFYPLTLLRIPASNPGGLLQISLPHQAPARWAGEGARRATASSIRQASAVAHLREDNTTAAPSLASELSPPCPADRSDTTRSPDRIDGFAGEGWGTLGLRPSGALASRLSSRRYGDPTPPARTAGRRGARGLGAALLPSARAAPAPGPAPLTFTSG